LGDESIIEESFKERTAGEKKDQPETAVSTREPYSFAEAVEMMRFPRAEPGAKKGQQGDKRKKEIKINPEHLTLERIDLSGFKNKRFSRSGLRELLDGLQNLPCIRTVVLRENGINEDCEAEILELFTITNVKCIDLSKNAIGPRLAGMIGKKLKDEVTHIQWLDLTQNEFYSDNLSNSMIV
jgi:hypothetical protein